MTHSVRSLPIGEARTGFVTMAALAREGGSLSAETCGAHFCLPRIWRGLR